MKVFLRKIKNGFMPAGDDDDLSRIKHGRIVECTITEKRNNKFHSKFFALLNIGFDLFEPDELEHKGKTVIKNFERFRKDVIISCGHYDMVFDINGKGRAQAHSMSFAQMTEEEFSTLYNSVIDLFLLKIAKGQSRESIDNWVNQIMEFS